MSMTKSRGENIGIGLYLLVCLLSSVGLWVAYFTYEPPVKSGFRWVAGIVKSAELQRGTGRILDVRFVGDEVIYRVSKDDHNFRFKRKQFLRDVVPGDAIDLMVEKGEPSEPLLSSDKIHFIHGARKGEVYYSKVEDYISWSHKNNKYALIAALLMTFGASFLSWVLIYLKAAGKRGGVSH